MDRAYSLLQVKSVDADRRVFSGMASTPELDRQGDSVDPIGCIFKNPLPLLLHHNQTQPIGTVVLTKTAKGIHFEATLPRITEPGRLKDRVDEAWHSIKAGIITGVSIGFRLLEHAIEQLATGGRRLKKTEIFELSLVTIPANASATILTVKSLAASSLAMVALRQSLVQPSAPKEAPRMPAPLPRLSDVTKQQVREQQSLDFMRYLSTLALVANGELHGDAAEVYLKRFPESFSASTMRKMLEQHADFSIKAAVAPGTSTDSVWAKPLVGVQQITTGFLQVAHSESLLGRLGLELIPFNAKIPFQTADGGGCVWMPENYMAPTSKIPFSDGLTLPATKIVRIAVLSKELVKLSSPGTAKAMRSALVDSLNAFIDKQLLDPTVAAVVGTNPASVTNGTTPLTGTSDVKASVQALISAFFTASPGSTAPVLIANGGYAAAIRGQQPGFGLEVFASEAVGTNIVMLDPARVFYADGGLEVDLSEYAMLEMADPATNPPTAAAVLTSLWQQNLVGYRLTRFVSWGAAPNAVKYSTMP
jgi:HK97 family phage prohead protease